MEVVAHDSCDASMKHLTDFFPLRGGEVGVHVFQRTRVESFDLEKKRSIFHYEWVGNFWAWPVRLFAVNGRSLALTSFAIEIWRHVRWSQSGKNCPPITDSGN